MSYSQPTGDVAYVAPAPGTFQSMPGERFTRIFVTVDAALVILLAFLFGFGNGWATARILGISPWIAPLIQPAVDLAVVGLMIGIRYLAIHGWTDDQLSKPRAWLRVFGTMTLVMNTALPIGQHHLGRAAWDAVGPILLIAWSELAPWLLRAIYSVRAEALATVEQADAEPEMAPVVEPEPERAQDESPRPLTDADLRPVVRDRILVRQKRKEGYDGLIGEVFELFWPVWKPNGVSADSKRRWVGMVCQETWDALYEDGLVTTPRRAKRGLHAL